MTMKAEPFSSSKKNFNGSRTNLSISSELSSPIYPEEPLSSLFTLDTSQQEPQSAETLMLQLNTPICVARIYRDDFFEHVSLITEILFDEISFPISSIQIMPENYKMKVHS